VKKKKIDVEQHFFQGEFYEHSLDSIFLYESADCDDNDDEKGYIK
jgi:hypothetical protein